ncbi:MAG: hypothetical protein IIX22_02305, partial [Ruminococcus sp.]|nr:hypothetical protein [Ruminococcus sp.]
YVYIEESSDVGYIKKNIPAYPKCGGDTGSFVKVSLERNNYVYTVCLYDDKGNYIYASEKNLY